LADVARVVAIQGAPKALESVAALLESEFVSLQELAAVITGLDQA
jgi:hypothetical protein